MTTLEDDARTLVQLHAAAVEADHQAAQDTTAATIEAALAAHKTLDDACETFRRRWYPRTYKVIAVFGEVYTMSRTGRSTRLVWSQENDR